MFPPSSEAANARLPKKLRSACDLCHETKVKCSGGKPCNGCRGLGIECAFSVSSRIGRPKGTRNKATLERITRLQATKEANGGQWHESVGVAHLSAMNEEDHNTDRCTTDISSPQSTNPEPQSSLGEGFWSSPGSFRDQNGSGGQMGMLQFRDQFDLPELEEPWSSASHSTETSTDGSFSQPTYSVSSNVSPPKSMSEDGSAGNDLDAFGAIARSDFLSIQDQVYGIRLSPSMPPLALPLCACLEHQAALLCHLKFLSSQQRSLQIDVALVSAQRAIAVWTSFLECPVCQQDEICNVSELLSLSVMNIRTTLQILQNLCCTSGEERRQQQTSQGESNVRSTIGVYEISGEESVLVTNLLVLRTTDKINALLCCLMEKAGQANIRATALVASAHMPDSNDLAPTDRSGLDTIHHVQKMIMHSGNTIQALKVSLRS